MATIEDSPCPACKAPPGTLTLVEVFECDPPGSNSLAGVMFKVGARLRPALRCSVCPLDLVGEYDGRHVVFDPPA